MLRYRSNYEVHAEQFYPDKVIKGVRVYRAGETHPTKEPSAFCYATFRPPDGGPFCLIDPGDFIVNDREVMSPDEFYSRFEEIKVECPSCDGTGQVHSHNPKCWDCHGSGKVSQDKYEVVIKNQRHK